MSPKEEISRFKEKLVRLSFDLYYLSFVEGYLHRELSERGKLSHPVIFGIGKMIEEKREEIENVNRDSIQKANDNR